ncbi:c-type cytochrome [Panacibacter ginsenosidivorans]|uniref:C-type cytochrome n=1 Tax=Panacibacter ginsenosidivorans TaxID=1813871 RepID=A0A5B8V687_9BACT|nr:c-type cytochrome [Panacibacter ginsenosidivorans]QEC66615.1 c-type cytochrome [Panacibacter ginsenosidivorans]
MHQIRQLLLYSITLVAFTACNNNDQQNEITSIAVNLPDSVAAGKKLFDAACVRCHGMDASGLTGPSLKRSKLKHAPDLASFISVVEFGIVGTGMPSNWAITDSDCHRLYAYINFLKNQGRETPKGDSVAGSKVYASAGCASCHIMNGEGNSIGPELSQIGASRNAAYLKQALIDPAAALPESTDIDNGYGFSLYLPIKIITNDGKKITGLRINEDTYTIQLKDAANNYYSFNKDEVQSVEKQYGQSLMPSFKDKLSDKEIENLVAFLYKSGNQ